MRNAPAQKMRPFSNAHLTPLAVAILFMACSQPAIKEHGNTALSFPGEKHIQNLRQLTAGGTNAEAYWSFDGKWLTFQAKGDGVPGQPKPGPQCDQIFAIRADGSEVQNISKNTARTTCSFFLPGDRRVLFSSTLSAGKECPAEPDKSRGYVWPIYNSYQFYSSNIDGSDVTPMEPGAPSAYNAEAVTCRDRGILFTSDRDGDLELYRGKLDRAGQITDIKRLTQTLGYDGGAFFSQDCKKIVWRASRPKPGKEADEYLALLKQHLVRPSQLEIWTADADGKNAHQVTRLGAASFAPYFTPDAKRILFASNVKDPRGRGFDILMINVNGTGLEQITRSGTFDSFPMFSPDGKHLAFSSNRNAKSPRETNVFIADWHEQPAREISVSDSDPADRFMAVVKSLSSDEMGGRGIGTTGMAQAEKFVAEQFEAVGLKPYALTPTDRPFFHAVEVRSLDDGKIVQGNNVVGSYGNGCGTVRPVIVGAHLDHLGMESTNSLESDKKGIHHGADDNASGIAALIEVARQVVANPNSKKGCAVFAAFTAEESGVGGSARFVEALAAKRIQPKVMLNMDMVGRLQNNQLLVFGTASAKEWPKLVQDVCVKHSLTCPGGGDGYGPSDQMPFYAKGVPVLHFFTGPHADYHRVSDTWDKVNATGGVQVADAVAAVAIRSLDLKAKFQYVKAAGKALMGAVHSDGHPRSKGGYLGTIPDYAKLTSPSGPGGDLSQGGVLLSGARAGSPAEIAGIQSGDILVSIVKKDEADLAKKTLKVKSLQDFTTVLSGLSPGEDIVLVVRREEKLVELATTVGKRQ